MFARRHNLPSVMCCRLFEASVRRSLQILQIVVGCSVAFYCAAAQAQDAIDPRLEYNVKAVSLYAFGRYVTWPEAAFPEREQPVCDRHFWGESVRRRARADRAEKNAQRAGDRGAADREAGGMCRMSHCVRDTTRRLRTTEAQLFQQAAGKPVLLVGESPGFAARGGVINFYHSGSNVRFELNPDKSVENKLSLNAKLLTLGTRATSRQ